MLIDFPIFRIKMAAEEETGAVLYSRPYQLCVLPDFITSSSTSSSGGGGGGGGFLQQLRGEVSRLKFAEKNNDLYQFHQVYLYIQHSHTYCSILLFYIIPIVYCTLYSTSFSAFSKYYYSYQYYCCHYDSIQNFFNSIFVRNFLVY